MAQRNQITGKVIAISDKQTIASKDANKQPVVKRQLFLDCTRYDPYTGERGFENTPLLEFTNKGLEKLEALMAQGLAKDDIVTISFDVQGNKWTNQEGKMQVITNIKPYDIEKKVISQQQPAEQPQNQQQAPQGQPQGQQQGHTDANGEPLPF